MKNAAATLHFLLGLPKEGGYCYLGICRARDAKRIKRSLARMPNVYRITDHGSHLKVKVRGTLAPVRGLRAVRVKDETTHFDARYWDFAFGAYAHSVKRGHSPRRALAIMVHYCFNLLGAGDEADYFAGLALRRARLDASVTGEQSHGWEYPHIEALRRRKRA